MSISLRMPVSSTSLQTRLFNNCSDLLGAGSWLVQTPRRSRFTFGATRGYLLTTGAIDLGGRRGESHLSVRSGGFQIEDPFRHNFRPTLFAALGLELAGSRAFLTGQITRGRNQFSGARRARLGLMRGITFESGTLIDPKTRQPVPNTYVFGATGRLTMLGAMARGIERVRCKNRRRFAGTRRIRPGFGIGTLSVGIRPGAAVGLAGTGQVDIRARRTDTDEAVPVEPTGGATLTGGILNMPLNAGQGVPLSCNAGITCFPSSGAVGFGAGFDFVLAGRRASLANIALTNRGNPADEIIQTLTGTLDGAPVTIGEGTEGQVWLLTDDFKQRLGAALGTEISGSARARTLFTRTGPA